MSEKDLTLKQETATSAARQVESRLIPAVDIYESDDRLTLVADLPGVAKDHLTLGIEQGILTIEALAQSAGAAGGIYREFGTTGYSRRFQLPDILEFDKVAAELRDGVLTVTLPKAAAARPRRIPVTVH